MKAILPACIVYLALSTFASSASASQWMKINESCISSSYVDIRSVTPTAGNNYGYAVKIVPSLPRAIDEEFERDDVGQVIINGEIDCKSGSYLETAVQIYSTSGKRVAAEAGKRVWKPVGTGTLESGLSELICSNPS